MTDLTKLGLKYWPLDYRDMYEERAGILEANGIPREKAEQLAREIVVELARKEAERGA